MAKVTKVAKGLKDWAIAVEDERAVHTKEAERRLGDAIRTIETEVQTWIAEKLGGEAKTQGSKESIAQAAQFRADLSRIFNTFYETAAEVTTDYGTGAKKMVASLESVDIPANFSSADKSVVTALAQIGYNEYENLGKNFEKTIGDALYQAVLTRQPMADIMDMVKNQLTGVEDKRGRPMSSYAKQMVNDEFMKFHRAFTVQKAEALGVKQFQYVGSLIEDSRDFCVERAGRVFTIDEVKSWEGLDWKGKNPDVPVMISLGGYNCRHHLQPVATNAVADYLEEKRKAREARRAAQREAIPEVTSSALNQAETAHTKLEQAEKALRKAQREADKADAAVEEVAPPVDITEAPPKAGTATGKVWEIARNLQATLGRTPTRKEVMDAATAAGINEATASTQFAKWKKEEAGGQPPQPPAPPVIPPVTPPPVTPPTQPPTSPQGGIKRPTGKTGQVWDIADKLAGTKGAPPTRAEVIAAAVAEGLNAATASTQYAKWRNAQVTGDPDKTITKEIADAVDQEVKEALHRAQLAQEALADEATQESKDEAIAKAFRHLDLLAGIHSEGKVDLPYNLRSMPPGIGKNINTVVDEQVITTKGESKDTAIKELKGTRKPDRGLDPQAVKDMVKRIIDDPEFLTKNPIVVALVDRWINGKTEQVPVVVDGDVRIAAAHALGLTDIPSVVVPGVNIGETMSAKAFEQFKATFEPLLQKEKELSSERSQVRDALLAVLDEAKKLDPTDDEKRQKLLAETTRWSDRLQEIHEEQAAQEEAIRKATNILRANDPMLPVAVIPKSKQTGVTPALEKQAQKRLEEAVAFLTSLVEKDALKKVAMATVNLNTKLKEPNGDRFRAGFSSAFNEIQLHPDDDVSISVHEFGHFLEANLQGVGGPFGTAVEFVKARTEGETPKKLKDLFPNAKYRDDEVTKEDKFPDPYMGKIYAHGGTEILSMLTQYLQTEPGKLVSDPELFAFLYCALKGIEWTPEMVKKP